MEKKGEERRDGDKEPRCLQYLFKWDEADGAKSHDSAEKMM